MEFQTQAQRRQRRVSLAAAALWLAVLAVLGFSGLAQAKLGASVVDQEYDDPPLAMIPITLEEIRARLAPEQPAPQSVPTSLLGKIIFLSSVPSEYSDEPALFALDPRTGELWKLNELWPHECAEQRDAFSANRQYHAFLAGEGMHVGWRFNDYDELEPDHALQLQLKYYDRAFAVTKTLTRFGASGYGGNPNANRYGDEFEWVEFGHVWDPAWSPTDDLIVFVSNETRNDEIYVVAKDQWPPRQLTRNEWAWDKHPSWSPDGQQIVFESNRDGQQRLWLMNADGGNQRPLTDPILGAYAPVWVKYVGADGCP